MTQIRRPRTTKNFRRRTKETPMREYRLQLMLFQRLRPSFPHRSFRQ